MPLRLKNPKTVPKDGFIYRESNGRLFGGMFSFKYVVNEIVAYRKGNNLPRATSVEASDDLDAFTCNRDASLCYDPGASTPERERQGGSCASCGGITIT